MPDSEEYAYGQPMLYSLTDYFIATKRKRESFIKYKGKIVYFRR